MSAGWHASAIHSSRVVLTSTLCSCSFFFTFEATWSSTASTSPWVDSHRLSIPEYVKECCSVAFSKKRAWSHFGSMRDVEGTVSCSELVKSCPSYVSVEFSCSEWQPPLLPSRGSDICAKIQRHINFLSSLDSRPFWLSESEGCEG